MTCLTFSLGNDLVEAMQLPRSIECMDGRRNISEAYGVIDAQPETDTLGVYSLNYATLWIKDRSEDDRRLLTALENRLQNGTAAIVVDKFAKIKSRGKVSK